MPNLFVSYARPDEAVAKRVAEALRTEGYEVWRDDELPAHRAYADVIEERIKDADAVVALWSADAAKSQWVRAEADAARSSNRLIQASLDGTIPPMPFNQIQCADLNGWGSGGDSPGWRKLVQSVRALAGVTTEKVVRAPRRHEVSVCVLPFANMSGDAEQEYFSDGISEDITTDLSKVSALGVTARNTAFMFKGQGADVCEIAQKLGVSHVLEGSVRKAGGRVRITAQLVEGTSGDHVWAERYDRELTDIFAIQDEISKAIVDALKIKLLPEEKKAIEQRGTNSAEAYNLYLMARRYWITGNWGDTRQLELVIRICQRAVEIDPNYARAWGLMAIVQSILHFTFNLGDDDGTAAAEKALALDPTIAEAYCVRARHQYEKGEFGKADELLARAVELDRNSWEVNRETARIFFFQRRFEEAVRHWERAVAVDDTDYHSWGMMCSAYEALGDQEKLRHAAEMALMHSERVLANDPTNGAAHGIGAFGLAMRGERDRLKDWIARALLVSPDNIIMRYNFACTTALYMDDRDAALDLLEPVLAEVTESAYKAISSDPDMDSLRGDPRFKRMMEGAAKRLGIASPTPAAAT